jgi:putative transposase
MVDGGWWMVDERTQLLSVKIVEIAQVHCRFGYRRIHDLLRPEFPGVNYKRVYRLYSHAQLAIRCGALPANA